MADSTPSAGDRLNTWIKNRWEDLIVNTTEWRWLFKEIYRRTFSPAKSVSFVLFVLIALCALGGLGIWIEALRYWYAQPPKDFSNLTTALLTFFPSIIGAATFQLILDKKRSVENDKALAALSLSVLVLFMMMDGALAYINTYNELFAYKGGIVLSVASIYVWWLMNADSAIFKETLGNPLGPSTTVTPKGGVPSDFKQ